MADKGKVRNRNENKTIKKNEKTTDDGYCQGKQDKGKLKYEDDCDRKTSNDENDQSAAKAKERKWREIDKKKLAELAEAFHLFDFDRDGIISVSDLKKVYASLDKGEIDDDQIQQMIAEGANPLDFDGFVKLMGFKTLDMDEEDVLVEALSQWDYGTGFISEKRIRHDLMTWGDRFTEEEADAALEHAPIVVTKNKEKMIDYVQFSNDLCGFRRARNLLKEKL